jgi:hypothetical protein
VHYLGSADTNSDFQYLRAGYLLTERSVEAGAGLLNKLKVKSRCVDAIKDLKGSDVGLTDRTSRTDSAQFIILLPQIGFDNFGCSSSLISDWDCASDDTVRGRFPALFIFQVLGFVLFVSEFC